MKITPNDLKEISENQIKEINEYRDTNAEGLLWRCQDLLKKKYLGKKELTLKEELFLKEGVQALGTRQCFLDLYLTECWKAKTLEDVLILYTIFDEHMSWALEALDKISHHPLDYKDTVFLKERLQETSSKIKESISHIFIEDAQQKFGKKNKSIIQSIQEHVEGEEE